MHRIDVNADLGEDCGDDQALLPLITSANIATGGHAGGGHTLTQTVQHAIANRINIGAHISYPDRANFGRVSMLDTLTPSELAATLTEQLRHIYREATQQHAAITHVKPHGALYNDANRDADLADHLARILIVTARNLYTPVWPLFGLPNSVLHRTATYYRIPYIPEAFADRAYQPDGTLTPRSEPHAVHHDTTQVVAQAVQIATTGTVITVNSAGERLTVPVPAATLCVHGDTPDAVQHTRAIRDALQAHNITVTGFNKP